MVTHLPSSTPKGIIYSDSDGQPMADNTKQFELIVWIKNNLAKSKRSPTSHREARVWDEFLGDDELTHNQFNP